MNLDDPTPRLLWFTTFHLNLMYSCIEEEQRAEVIRRCYRPLLELADECGAPLGIEASGITLEIIDSIDPTWVGHLRRLMRQGKVEFIGSGYAQIIGPLVPAGVNAANLRLGHHVYERLLGTRPRIALVNEQAYSSGMVEHYLQAGYRAIIMEWQNPAHAHPEWSSEWRYLPQWACDQRGDAIPLIWNNSIAFQKFQRLVHGEIDLDDYLDFLEGQIGSALRALSLYGNDVEIFDFRPGRYATEASLSNDSEWSVMRKLFARLGSDSRFRAVRPREVLALMTAPGGGNRLQLESPNQPVPVKKQDKYNLTRWSVTGRDNLGINTRCWRIYQTLHDKLERRSSDWQELCYLWSSDFRTHITERRWRAYQGRLADFEKKLGCDAEKRVGTPASNTAQGCEYNVKSEKDGRFVIVEAGKIKLRLNLRRGLAIDALWFRDVSDAPLIGTLPHGFYDDIRLAADFYTGHLTFEIPGQSKVTDLNPVEPRYREGRGWLDIGADVPTPLGWVQKNYRLFDDGQRLQLEWRLDWKQYPSGSLRLGHVTLNPEAFDRASLYFRTQSGGYGEETFSLDGTEIDHGAPVSSLVSANCGLAPTGGWVELGDSEKRLRVEIDQSVAALLAMIQYKAAKKAYFCRLSFSAQEMDETRNLQTRAVEPIACRAIRLVVSAQESCRYERDRIQEDGRQEQEFVELG
jgi:Glycosyl hydrolase family 57